MKYYGVRNGKINLKDLKIPFNKFRSFFMDTIVYFEKRGISSFFIEKTSTYKVIYSAHEAQTSPYKNKVYVFLI